jgi:uncharacterized Tic20 family protein
MVPGIQYRLEEGSETSCVDSLVVCVPYLHGYIVNHEVGVLMGLRAMLAAWLFCQKNTAVFCDHNSKHTLNYQYFNNIFSHRFLFVAMLLPCIV